MAQTGFTPISLYYTTTASAAPTAGNLVAGELAINTNDGVLYYKDSSGVVQSIASKAGNSGSFTNLAYTGTLTGGTGVVNLGSGQFYKDSSGNVGIGTSSPNQKLSVFDSTNALTYQMAVGVSSSFCYNIGRSPANALLTFYGTQAGGTGYVFSGVDGERMRIDSSGNLLVGTTSVLGGSAAKLQVSGTTNGAIIKSTTNGGETLSVWNSDTTGNNPFVSFYTEGTPTFRGGITYNRAGGLVSYNATSDYRAKDVISPVLNSGEVIDSVPVYMGKMKGATQERPMFIAHETPDYAHTGEKDAVDKDGNPVYQQMDASSLVPVLWAEIQSLRKRVAQLESK